MAKDLDERQALELVTDDEKYTLSLMTQQEHTEQFHVSRTQSAVFNTCRSLSSSSSSLSGSTTPHGSEFRSTSLSGSTTPHGSEFRSTELDQSYEGSFLDVLTRRMADGMLREEDDGHDYSSERCKLKNQQSVNWSGVGEKTKVKQLTPRPLQSKQRVKEEKQINGYSSSISHKNVLIRHRRARGVSGSSTDASDSDMRLVVLGLGGSGLKTSSCGTGVFLPRGTHVTSTDPTKKKGCSTVLIPTRVLQALNQHFNKMGSMSQPSVCAGFNNYLSKYDDVKHGDIGSYSHQEQIITQSEVHYAVNHQDLNLPKEWTY